MIVVGVGCGPGMLTEAAITAIQSARLIVGSARALDLVTCHLPAESEVRIIEDYKALRTLPGHAVVLSTGDPMISGLGYLGGEIIPGISSVQSGAAKTGVSLTNMFLITAHGRDHKQAISDCHEMVKKGRKTCIIADPAFPVDTLATSLAEINPGIRIIVCENLGYPDERICVGTAEHPPMIRKGMFILFVTGTGSLDK